MGISLLSRYLLFSFLLFIPLFILILLHISIHFLGDRPFLHFFLREVGSADSFSLLDILLTSFLVSVTAVLRYLRFMDWEKK